MAKRVADGIPEDEQVKKPRADDGDVQKELLRLVATSPPSSEADPPDNTFWQLYIAQIEKFLVTEHGCRGKPLKRVRWTGYYRRKTDEYDVELPLDYYRVRVVRNSEHKLTLSAIQKDTGDMFIIRRVASADSLRIQQLFRSLMIHRLIPTDTVMRPSEMYIREGFVYTCTEYMECQLREVIEDPSTHFCVGRIIHQLLLLLNRMHKMGLAHGNINTSSVYYDSDTSIKLADFGVADEAELDPAEASKKDLLAIRSILAKLLLSSDAESDKPIEEDDDELEWKSLAESSADSGLTEENSRDLLDLMFENKYSCEDLLKHPYFQSFKVLEYFEPEYGELLDLSMKKTQENNAEIV